MSETVIFSLSQQDVDVEQIARDFAQEFAASRPQLLVELAKMICSLCQIPSFPQRMIENADLFAVNAFLQKSLKPSAKTRNAVNDLLALEVWPNVQTFFRHLIYLEWDFLSGATKFDSFFNEFLNALTAAELPILRYVSTAVQLEFTTVCAQDKIELLQNESRPAILNYTTNVLRNSFHDNERQIWAHSLSQTRQWFRNHAFLLDDKLLRLLLWGLTDRAAANTHLCLQISLELLDEHSEQKELLTKFLQSLVRALTPGLATQDMYFFENLCELAIILHNKYEDVNRGQKFVDLVLQFTFAVERPKAKVAGYVFMSTKLRNLSTSEQLRCIVHFLASQNSVFVELFVDAMIEDCRLLTSWENLANGLRELSEMSEKEMLLLVILCGVSSMLGEGPAIRGKPEMQPPENLRAAMTSVFAPLLLTLSYENVSFRWKSLLVKLAMYFDLDCVEKAQKAEVLFLFVKTCIEGSSVEVFDVAYTSMMLQLVFAILQHEPVEAYNDAIVELKTGYEQEFVQLERRLRQYPAQDFIPLMNIVVGLYTCRSIMSLDEKCLFDMPMKLLHMECTSDDSLMSFCHEVAIMLSSDYVVELLSNSVETPDMAQLERIQEVFFVICDCLDERFHTRVGELAYLALCRMVKTLFAKNVNEGRRNAIFTKRVSQSLCTYVGLALRNIVVVQLPALELSTFSMENIISCFVDLILSDILPLSYATELLHAHCSQTTKLENELRNFFADLVNRRFADEVAQLIFHYFAEEFKIADENLLTDLAERAKRLSQLLYSVRNSMPNVTKKVHMLGIDFAVSPLKTQGGLLAVRFLFILVEFSNCLETQTKKACFEYFKRKQIVGNLSVAKVYFNSLRVGKRRSVVEDTVSTRSSSGDVDEPEPVVEDSDQYVSDSGSSRNS